VAAKTTELIFNAKIIMKALSNFIYIVSGVFPWPNDPHHKIKAECFWTFGSQSPFSHSENNSVTRQATRRPKPYVTGR